MKKLISLFIFGTLFFNTAYGKEIKFAQVSGVQMNGNPTALKTFIKEINNMNDIDFVIFTGDNIGSVKPNNYQLFMQNIKDIKHKTYVTLGDKDVNKRKGLTKEIYMKAARKYLGMHQPKTANYYFKKDDIVFVIMNGSKENVPSINGYYKTQELVWLDKVLTEFKQNKVVIIQHFPLVDSNNSMMNLYGKEEYINVLKKHNNVISIISGHYNSNIENKVDGIYNIVTPPFKDGYWKLIEIDTQENFVYTTLINEKG